MHRYHKILTHVKKKLGSIIFLENLLSLHNVTFIINKVSSAKRPLACSSEGGLSLSFYSSITAPPSPCFLHFSRLLITGKVTFLIRTGLRTSLSLPFPSVLKPIWDLQGVNKSSARSKTFSAGTTGIWKLLPVVFRQSRVWQAPGRRNASPACLASLGLTFSRNGEQEFC